MPNENSNTQAYNVLRIEEEFEIRFYPSVTVATISSIEKTYRALGSSGFSKLAGYIFGDNSKNLKIAMTSPVHMNINDSISSMSFVMPSQYHESNLPKPNNSEVKIQTTNEEFVAALKFGGFASDKHIKENIIKLQNALKLNSITYYGNFRFYGYDPPYRLFGRRNEIIVKVNLN